MKVRRTRKSASKSCPTIWKGHEGLEDEARQAVLYCHRPCASATTTSYTPTSSYLSRTEHLCLILRTPSALQMLHHPHPYTSRISPRQHDTQPCLPPPRSTTLAGLLLLWPIRAAGTRATTKAQVKHVLELLHEVERRGFVVARTFETRLRRQWVARELT